MPCRISLVQLVTVKPEKNTTIKFHENALKQFSRRLKFTNLASEQQKNSNLPKLSPELGTTLEIHEDTHMTVVKNDVPDVYT